MERSNKAHNLLHEVGERGTMKSLLLAQEATGKASTSISAAQLLAARNKQKSKNTPSSSGSVISKSSSSKTAGKPPHK